MTLNRRDQVLKYIVEYYIRTAQAVGSHTLIDEYHLPYSSATIRSEMNALEQMGLIEKVHSSSGRIPSSDGYRFYCQYLRDVNVDSNLKSMLQVVLEERSKSIESVMKESCELLSHMTNLASVILGPSINEEKLASINVVPLTEKTATVIFVTNKGYCENKTFVLNESISMEELKKCMELLNARLIGTPISEVIEKMNLIKPLLTEQIINHDAIYKALMETFVKFASDRLSLYGKEELLSQPEFMEDAEKIKQVLSLLEDATSLKEAKATKTDIKEGNITIHIGNENDDNPDVSIVKTKIKIGDDETRTLALVGPKRMDYAKVLSSLQYIIEEINRYYK